MQIYARSGKNELADAIVPKINGISTHVKCMYN